MNFEDIERKVHKALEDGTVHHLYDNEARAYSMLLMHPDELKKYSASVSLAPSISMYQDLLGPNQVRSIKNGLISYLTLVTRAAIRAGLDPEFSYALSDYYINYLETLSTIEELSQLTVDITLHFNDLIYRSNEAPQKIADTSASDRSGTATPSKAAHSKAVASALRYMQQHLYTKCTVKEVAAFVSLEPHYFSGVFKKETGHSPVQYLTELKIKEARRLLSLPGNSVTYVATVLCFSDTAHFSKRFKQITSMSPMEYKRQAD